jgi:hypothetical protein
VQATDTASRRDKVDLTKQCRFGKNGNGLTLLERFIPDGLSNAATTLVDSLKINSTSEKVRRRRRVVIKRRNIYGEQLADLANLYFRMSAIPIRFWSKVDDLEALGNRMFQNAERRSFSRLCLGRANCLRRKAAAQKPVGSSAPGYLVERPFFVSSPHDLVSNRKDSILSFGKTTEKSNRCHPGAILH